MKYKIVPVGKTEWAITCYSYFIFKHYLCKTGKFELAIFLEDKNYYMSRYSSVEGAKEALKTIIIYEGICLAHEKQRKKAIKIHRNDKAVTVPPWK